MAAIMGEWARSGWLNIVGGCCGTTAEHIRAPETITGRRAPRRSNSSSSANSAALAFNVSKMVSPRIGSTPPSTSAAAASP